jgi:broad specificity phosphatase PhoE
MMSRRTSLVLTATLAWSLAVTSAFAQRTVFVVRHAERADTESGAPPTGGSDPDLSQAGQTRAAALAAVLRDANIRTIFVTEYKRTQQTAAPLAKRLGIQPTRIVAKDTPALIAAITNAPGAVLVVGHSNSVPEILKMLGVAETISIGDNQYDDLFVVRRSERTSLLRLHYQPAR